MSTTPPDPNQPFGTGQPSYAAYPTDPTASAASRPGTPARPASIALAVKLMWVGAALSALSLLYSLTTLDGMKDNIEEQLRKNDLNVTQADVDAVFAVAVAFAVLFGLVGAILWMWMAWKNGQGRNWARVVATVFAGLNLLGLFFTLASGSVETLTLVSSVASVILAVAILVLLWRKEASQFYQAAAASRRMY